MLIAVTDGDEPGRSQPPGSFPLPLRTITLQLHSHIKRDTNPSFLVILLRLHSRSVPSASATMSLHSDIEKTSQASTNHSVAVCKNSTTNQAYYYFSKDCCSLQFSVVKTSLRGIGYDDIHFLPFLLR